jgi:hypothetical protein
MNQDKPFSSAMKKIKFSLLGLIMAVASSCGGNNLFEAVFQNPQEANEAISGDIIVVSGGTATRLVTPFPLHRAALFSSTGQFKRFLYEASTTEFLYGGTLDSITGDFLYVVDTVDRVDRVDLNSFSHYSVLLDGNLTGANLRAVESLSDGNIVVAESPTVIEKYSAAGVRQGAPFPLTIPTAINAIKKISGNRFVVTFTTNPDSPRVYSNAGTLLATFPITSPCTNSCDPYDVVELSDGRFVVNSRATSGVYLYSSTFTYVGVLYLDTTIINQPSSMALLKNNNLLVCNTSFNTCEEISISGNTGTRVGSTALINNVAAMRQPLSTMVIP